MIAFHLGNNKAHDRKKRKHRSDNLEEEYLARADGDFPLGGGGGRNSDGVLAENAVNAQNYLKALERNAKKH